MQFLELAILDLRPGNTYLRLKKHAPIFLKAVSEKQRKVAFTVILLHSAVSLQQQIKSIQQRRRYCIILTKINFKSMNFLKINSFFKQVHWHFHRIVRNLLTETSKFRIENDFSFWKFRNSVNGNLERGWKWNL